MSTIGSKSKMRLDKAESGHGEDLLHFLQDKLEDRWDITPDMIVAKPELSDQWLVMTKSEAEKRKLTGRTIKEELNLQGNDSFIDLKKEVEQLINGRKQPREGYPMSADNVATGMDNHRAMSKEHLQEKKFHKKMFPSENQPKAFNRRFKEQHSKVRFERKKMQDEEDNETSEEDEHETNEEDFHAKFNKKSKAPQVRRKPAEDLKQPKKETKEKDFESEDSEHDD